MHTTRSLIQQMQRSQQNSPAKTQRTSLKHTRQLSSHNRPKISIEREKAEIRYKKLTNLTKSQMIKHVDESKKERLKKNPQWKYEHYRINNTFSVFEKHRGVEQFPHNNKKYNVQFLDKTLQGGKFNLTVKDNGFFPKPRDRLYSNHYKPIVAQKRKYNEDYELRASLFGKIDLDQKRDRIMDQYILQANPFSTQRSNALISTMRPARKHRFS